ncbi:MAG: NADH-quinone oxidoreductase subunit J [Thermoproteota archaeon]|nr:NADH-quinone oxidoreductase subunit J [Candidatus Brockarchaeota archaeon]
MDLIEVFEFLMATTLLILTVESKELRRTILYFSLLNIVVASIYFVLNSEVVGLLLIFLYNGAINILVLLTVSLKRITTEDENKVVTLLIVAILGVVSSFLLLGFVPSSSSSSLTIGETLWNTRYLDVLIQGLIAFSVLIVLIGVLVKWK